MSQYILTYPIDGKIYYSNTPKKAAFKAFSDLVKYNNYDQARIILKDNNTKNEYKYLAISDNKLKKYKNLFNSKNPIQIGGGSNISDKEFYEKLSDLSGDINISINELSKMLKNKYEPEDNNDIILLVKEGINKLDTMSKNVNNINKEVYHIRNKLIPNFDNDSDENINSPRNLIIEDIDPKKKDVTKNQDVTKTKVESYDETQNETQNKTQNETQNETKNETLKEESGGFCTIM